MKKERIIMGMTIGIEIKDAAIREESFKKVFAFFESVDRRFSTFKSNSEISKINRGEIHVSNYSEEMREIFALAETTKLDTEGYFDIKKPNGTLDPSGIVKGWAIKCATEILIKEGYKNFYIDAGGDIEARGELWKVGIRSPFEFTEIVKILEVTDRGVATSGNYVHKTHIYNPVNKTLNSDIVSLTVIGKDILEADRFATAAFAMGRDGIVFIERWPGLEGYMIDEKGVATMTSGFENYVSKES
jgi:thiamine biosynthesis lipoprotein